MTIAPAAVLAPVVPAAPAVAPAAASAPVRAAAPVQAATPTRTAAPAPTSSAVTTSFRGLAYDAFDALATAEFWAAALHADVAPGASPVHAELMGAERTGLPPLVFRQVVEGRELRTPLHLQLTTTDLDREVARLQRLGARRMGALRDGRRRTVTLADPEGNAFELVAA